MWLTLRIRTKISKVKEKRLNNKTDNKIRDNNKDMSNQQHSSDNNLNNQIDKHQGNLSSEINLHDSLSNLVVSQHLLNKGRKIKMKSISQKREVAEQRQFQDQEEPVYLEVMASMNIDRHWSIQSVQMSIARIKTILGTT